jgi:hAT family C-terminal dimerisation region
MARDYLAIQGSAVPLEWAFSSSGLTATTRHNRLTACTFESLQILKGAYRNGHMAMADQATAHLWDEEGNMEVNEGEGARES